MTYAAAPGTIEITSSIDAHQFEIYTLFFDNSMLTDATARDRDIATKTAMFNRASEARNLASDFTEALGINPPSLCAAFRTYARAARMSQLPLT